MSKLRKILSLVILLSVVGSLIDTFVLAWFSLVTLPVYFGGLLLFLIVELIRWRKKVLTENQKKWNSIAVVYYVASIILFSLQAYLYSLNVSPYSSKVSIVANTITMIGLPLFIVGHIVLWFKNYQIS